MAQMNQILRHGGGNNFPLSHTRCCLAKQQVGGSVRTIRAESRDFIPCMHSIPTFPFDNPDVASNDKKVSNNDKNVPPNIDIGGEDDGFYTV